MDRFGLVPPPSVDEEPPATPADETPDSDERAYETALRWLYGRLDLERAPDAGRGEPTLERVGALVRLLGHPERDLRIVHVTGTNGKTSSARMIAALLSAFGLSVGAYTSPHLERVNERLAWGGEPIADVELAEVLAAVALAEEAMLREGGGTPSFFEVLTAAAYRWFADVAVDVAAVEVGLGGRWDATNVGDATVAVVTNVAVDHVEYLGPTRAGIAAEKAGIVKPGCTLVLGETDPELVPLFLERGPGRVLLRDRDFGVADRHPGPGGPVVDLTTPGGRYAGIRLAVPGRFQADNAAVALTAVEAFFGEGALDLTVVRRALAAVRTPGRFEIVERDPALLLDGAHNPAGATALAAALDEVFPTGPRTFVVGLLTGREPRAMLEALGIAGAAHLVCCAPPSPRALDPSTVARAARELGLGGARVEVATSVGEALERARLLTPAEGVAVVTGSLYLVGAARAILGGRRPDERGPGDGPAAGPGGADRSPRHPAELPSRP